MWNELLTISAITGFCTLVFSGFFFLLCKNYFPKYVEEKAKNLAKKEDIEEITEKIEGVKHEYEIALQKFISRENLRSANFIKRMEVHQQGYVLASKLSNYADHPNQERRIVAEEFSKWRSGNRIYLDEKPSKILDEIWDRFHNQKYLNEDSASKASDNWSAMQAAVRDFRKSFRLPPINDE